MDPNTACNTHDLLECPCNGTGTSTPLEALDMSCALLQKEETDDSEDESETEKGFMAASQVKVETINKMDKAVSFSTNCAAWIQLTSFLSILRRRKLNSPLWESGPILTACDPTRGMMFTTIFFAN